MVGASPLTPVIHGITSLSMDYLASLEECASWAGGPATATSTAAKEIEWLTRLALEEHRGLGPPASENGASAVEAFQQSVAETLKSLHFADRSAALAAFQDSSVARPIENAVWAAACSASATVASLSTVPHLSPICAAVEFARLPSVTSSVAATSASASSAWSEAFAVEHVFPTVNAELLNFFEALRDWQPSDAHSLGDYVAEQLLTTNRYEALSDPRTLLDIYESFIETQIVDVKKGASATAGKKLRGRSNPNWRSSDGQHRTLSARALHRLWAEVAETLIEENFDDYTAFLQSFRRVVIRTVERHSTWTQCHRPKLETVPSTHLWVLCFSLRTGISPPVAFKTDAPIRRASILDMTTMGGLNGPVRRHKTRRNLLLWRYRDRPCRGLADHSAQDRLTYCGSQMDHAPAHWEILSSAGGSLWGGGKRQLHDHLRMVRRRRSRQVAA